MVKVSLSAFQLFFKNQGFESQLLKKTSHLPQDQLFVLLGQDEKLRDLVSQVQITKQEIPTSEKSRKPYYHIQFLLLLPVEKDIHDVGELLRFIQILNRAANIPGFEVSENEGVIYYRHAFFHAGQEIDEGLLRSIMGTILMQVNTFGRLIEEVSKGEKSCEEALQTLKKYEKSLHQAM